ncbi:MAG: hypothetical protein HKN47_22075 [Pirellulaceae bacterium]|nr:hypothetical protein [Pirellulaceae bacterium]
MKRFSLLTLLLSTAIAALLVSQFVMMRKLVEARNEIDVVRRKYGYIKVNDPSLTYVNAIAENEQGPAAMRLIVPAGSRYMLHLSDTKFDHETKIDTLPAATTISLNSWRNGADVTLSYAIHMENGNPVVHVHTETETLLTYKVPNWTKSGQPNEGTGSPLDGQREFSTDETIPIMTWRDTGTGRGIALWLEPHARYAARRNKQSDE